MEIWERHYPTPWRVRYISLLDIVVFKKLCVYYACVPEVSADCDNFFTCGQESTCRHVLGKEGKTK